MTVILEYLSCDGWGRNFSNFFVKKPDTSKKAIQTCVAIEATKIINKISLNNSIDPSNVGIKISLKK